MAHEKHGTHLYSSETGKFDDAALELLARRVEDGYWYYDEDEEKAKRILEDSDGKAAWRFLEDRCDYEYEYVEVRTV
jgi:hypothetical protein